MKPIRVLLADDHALVRAGVRSLLERDGTIEVVAEAGDGHQAVALVKTHHPDVVLMDISMPGLNGLEAARRVIDEHPTVRVLMLSMHPLEEYVWQALHAGASGYLLKNAAAAELELAVTAVARGETYLSPAVSKPVIEGYLQRVGSEPPLPGRLTPRQREVLQLIAEGSTTKQIATLLNVSEKTIQTHRMQLMKRLDIHDIAGLVRYAIRIGLVSAEE